MPCSVCHQEGHNKRTCPSAQTVAPVRASTTHRLYSEEQMAAIVSLFARPTTPVRVRATTPVRARAQPVTVVPPRTQNSFFSMWGENRPNNGLSFFGLGQPAQPAPAPPATPAEPEVLKREPLPKRISVAVFSTLGEEDKRCQVCLEDLTEDTLQLSVCGHNFCAGCYEDPRLENCGVCRKTL